MSFFTPKGTLRAKGLKQAFSAKLSPCGICHFESSNITIMQMLVTLFDNGAI